MKKTVFSIVVVFVFFLTGCRLSGSLPVTPSANDLHFSALAQSWDEGIPLGNAVVGVLVWQKDSVLRFSLDRTDLWDLRPMDSISGPNNRFSWVYEQVVKGDYAPVQAKYDRPYDRLPAPSKIPGAALEFPLKGLGEVSQVRLYLNDALCEVVWKNGVRMKTFVHADEPVGWFVFENLQDTLFPDLVPPRYVREDASPESGPVEGQDLSRLGYAPGRLERGNDRIVYRQEGWDGFFYDAAVQWRREGKTLRGVWSITSSLSGDDARETVRAAIERGVDADYRSHLGFWNIFWGRSSVSLPDTVLQKQYMNEMYKFGSAAREYSYPISLQAVWTADNGKLPPWKGDYHHDLNTQLSYWPCYAGNYLNEGLGYLNTLWKQRDTYRRFTRTYFETDGLNVPGVCTLTGEPMGGWIQYSMSQTTGAWLAHHFYLHWKYSADTVFLKERAYPFIRDVAVFLENISVTDVDGNLTLRISSSPEIFDNSIGAWFKTITNYDLALMKFAFGAASELAAALGNAGDAAHWKGLESRLPAFDTDETGCLTYARGFPSNRSHRHFSHAMAIHPLGLIDWSQGGEARRIIRATLQRLDANGPAEWTGYTYSWLGNMKARAFDGEGAAEALRIFAECFCLENTFHVNGDQSGTGKSGFTYRPFTLEGNFAFASGIQEMLLQSHTDTIRVFPAIPARWDDVSFDRLRAMGAFLVSARRENGRVGEIRVFSEQGGTLRLALPFAEGEYGISGNSGRPDEKNGVLTLEMKKGEEILIRP